MLRLLSHSLDVLVPDAAGAAASVVAAIYSNVCLKCFKTFISVDSNYFRLKRLFLIIIIIINIFNVA